MRNSDRKVCLLIIYNHRFDRNIPRLNREYENRFSHIFHIMPFYDGNNPDVIPVYESSFRFQGYIAQAYTHLADKGFTHFFVVADDMLLNPRLNEDSLWDVMQISESDNFITNYFTLASAGFSWSHLWDAVHYDPEVRGVEVTNIIPSFEEAKKALAAYGQTDSLLIRKLWRSLRHPFPRKEYYKLKYPLAGGYSDILLITSDVMPKFCQYSGAFAASGLFVELAVPTALMLILPPERLKTCSTIALGDGAMWSDDDMKFLEDYNFNISKLKENFPADKLFLHPIKLSKWQ